jgi:hypothetical protein
MMTDEVTILDYIDNIAVPGNVFANPANEYWALVCVRHGLEFLYRQAAQCDEVMRKLASGNNPKKRVLIWGNDPAMSGIPKPLLTCSFHWYAVSACQYVRTVGAIAHRHDCSRRSALDYLQAVIPEVLTFRNKVAAHFAWTTKNQKDNDAERLASVMPPLTFVDDSFHVGAWSVSIRRGEEESSSGVHSWSICKIHDELGKRYWPEGGGKTVPTKS